MTNNTLTAGQSDGYPVLQNTGSATLTAASYDVASGLLAINGANFTTSASDYSIGDIILQGDGGNSYVLTAGSTIVGTPTAGSLIIQLSNTDQLAVDGLLNANGDTAADGYSTYNLSTRNGWDASGSAAIAGVGITVGNSVAPVISSVSYDAASGVLTFAGGNLTNYGGGAGINLGNFTLSDNAGNSYSFDPVNDTVGNLTANGFILTLSSADQAAVNAFVKLDGVNALGGGAYNLSAGSGWDGDSGAAIVTQAVTAINVPPGIQSASYDAASGRLSISGANLTTSAADYNLADFSLQGDGGNSYALTAGSTIVGTPTAGSLTIQLSNTDQMAVDGLLNKSGAQANDGGGYGLAAASGWDGAASPAASAGITVGNSVAPVISSVSYDAASGVLTFAGGNLTNYGGGAGINLGNFTLSDNAGNSYSFDPVNDTVGNLTANGFILTLSSADQAAVNAFVKLDGVNALGGGAYNLSAGSGWDGDSGAAIVTQAVTAINVPPGIQSASYDAASGRLSISGANLTTSTADYNLADFSLQGDGGNSYALTAGSTIVGTPTAGSLTIQLSNTDQLAVDGLLNANGDTAADGSSTYNLSTSNGWDTSGSAAVASAGITVGNSVAPVISSVSYDAASGVLTFAGGNLTNYGGGAGINLGNFTLSDNAGNSYSFDPVNDTVGNLTAGGFSLTLSASDQAAVNAFVNLDGVNALGGGAYNLSADSGWDGDSGAAIVTQAVTAVNVPPYIQSASYNAKTGQLTLSGANLTTKSSDYNLTDVSLQGDGGNSYNLTNGSTIVGTPTSSGLTIQLSNTDQLAVDGLLNANGDTAADGYSTYNVSTSNGWDTTASVAIDTAGVTVSNSIVPTISSVSFNASTGTFIVKGSNFTNYGDTEGINLGNFTFTGDSGNSYSFDPSSDTVSNLTANSFTIALNVYNKEAVDGTVVTANGLKSHQGAAYIISTYSGWDGDNGNQIDTQVVKVNNVAPNLDSVSYDASSGQLTLNGNFLTFSASSYQVADFRLSGDGGRGYTLTGGSKVSSAPSSGNESLTIQLSAADQLAVDGLLNKSDIMANDGAAYNLSAGAGWDSGAGAIKTLGIAVSNVTPPSIDAVSYNAVTGVFSINGSNLVKAGSYNGITLGDFTFTGGVGGSYTFNAAKDVVSKFSATGFNITLGKAGQALVDAFVDHSGGSPNSGAAYNLSASANWDSDSGLAFKAQAVTVSNGLPMLNGAAYNGQSGILTLSGGFLTSAIGNYKISDFTLTGDGGAKYTLTNSSKLIAAPGNNALSIQLSATDRFAIDGLLNHDGALAGSGAAYNLSATAGWDTGAHAINTRIVTVGNATTPVLTSVGYNAATGVFTFSGANFSKHGYSNGIAQTDFTLSAGAGSGYTFTGKDKVNQLSASSFTITLGAADKAAVNALANANGPGSLSGAAYNISVSANWDSNSGAAIGAQPLTVSGASLLQTLVQAGLTRPDGIAVDGKGDVFFADYAHNAIREVAAGGHALVTLATISGSRLSGLAVDGGGDLFVADTAHKTIDEIFAGSTTATQLVTGLNTPAGIAVDSAGNLYFADSGNNTLNEIRAGTQTVQTLVAGLKSPAGVAVDAAGNVFFTDSGNNAVKELPAGGASVITLAASGFKAPAGIAVDSAGNLFIADSGNKAIKEIAAGAHSVTTILSTGLGKPDGVTLDSNGDLYITDAGNHTVKELAHAVYDFNSPLAGAQPRVINSLWENTGQIELSKTIFTAFSTDTTVSSANFSNSATADGSSDYLYYKAKTGGLYYDVNGVSTEIAIIGVGNHPPALSAGDFRLIA
ncbi:MAG: SMP-30/gluconolactonase/LRE family protein [Methylococcales bacterium]|nr:SMP-30/gluconolactonase/LRE family protein [Methylococcales bacterium]